jgi:2-haloacid dehalogenase
VATLAFDVYGTLVDTDGVVVLLRDMVGDHADEFARRWRDKQLEYSFRRALMRRYQPFSVCVAQSLDFVCDSMELGMDAVQKQSLLDFLGTLPAFPDAEPALQRMQQAGHAMYAFSNGTHVAVTDLLDAAGLSRFFRGVISVDDVKSFKPDALVYRHFLQRVGASAGDTWLVSGNSFDVIGAVSAGLRGAWIRRSPRAVFDPWDEQVDVVANSLADFAGTIV